MQVNGLHIDTYTLNKLYDPTRTTSLRNAFASVMNKRFLELMQVIAKTVNINDCFGLRKIKIFQMTPAQAGAFNFALSKDKLEAFMKWLQEQVDRGMLSIGEMQQLGSAFEKSWMNLYLFDSYKRGVIRARSELRNAGFDIPTIEETGGIEISMATPYHIDRLGLIYIRAYNELKGVTDAMASQIARILAQGLADGDGPALLARKLVSTIKGSNIGELGITDSLGRFIPAKRRAEMIARTETIRAHHVATVQEYRNWALEGVYVKAEWMTAGDSRVCSKCQKLQGKIFTLDEIEGMIPLHPMCRCIALPFREGIDTKTPSPFLNENK